MRVDDDAVLERAGYLGTLLQIGKAASIDFRSIMGALMGVGRSDAVCGCLRKLLRKEKWWLAYVFAASAEIAGPRVEVVSRARIASLRNGW